MWSQGVAALILAGCSFTPGQIGTAVDGPDDATVEPPIDAALDAPPDVPPTWQVVETMTIDTASSTAQESLTVLAAGVVYHLRASGVMTNVIDPYPGDADYFDFNDPKDLGCCEDIGIGIDDFVASDAITLPNWGPYNAAHVYEVEWTGDGTTIHALFQDTQYSNNVGDLTLEILELR